MSCLCHRNNVGNDKCPFLAKRKFILEPCYIKHHNITTHRYYKQIITQKALVNSDRCYFISRTVKDINDKCILVYIALDIYFIVYMMKALLNTNTLEHSRKKVKMEHSVKKL